MGTAGERDEGNWTGHSAPRCRGIYKTWQFDIAVRPTYIAHPDLRSTPLGDVHTWPAIGGHRYPYEASKRRGGLHEPSSRIESLSRRSLYCVRSARPLASPPKGRIGPTKALLAPTSGAISMPRAKSARLVASNRRSTLSGRSKPNCRRSGSPGARPPTPSSTTVTQSN